MNRRRITRLLLVPALLAAAAACSDATGPQPIPIEETEFAPELDVDLDRMTRLDSGVYIEDLVVGEGTLVTPNTVWDIIADYSLWLSNGTLLEEADSVRFNLGAGELIPGWEFGIPGMRVGGTRKLVIPYQLAYGAGGFGPVPPYANLVFEVELHYAQLVDEE